MLVWFAVAFAAALAVWLLAVVVVALATRPEPVTPGPAVQELGAQPEPPAVTNLLAHRWRLTEDAAEATLVDLAARRYLEFRQVGPEPEQTTIHLRVRDPAGLTPYERRVFDRVKALATDSGVVPLTALAFRDDATAGRWSGHA